MYKSFYTVFICRKLFKSAVRIVIECSNPEAAKATIQEEYPGWDIILTPTTEEKAHQFLKKMQTI